MTRAPVLFAFVCLLAGCDRPQALSVEALAADPVRLHALRAQCGRGEHDGAFCARVDQADLRRLLSGQAGPDEYQTLADLPPIPASFDEPMEARP
ncbi:hypothetical protein HFK84_06465 [Ralstonia pseudosolanacearum]|uniref:hypothetical protein n=1 Tax=Ralstonia pseudosolanacearum TaxID=1310165 RepID=UPI0020060AB1|nr:hypothetical protein [Ralstonia pseudosolanacearum]MCK4141931.1 hypothetical protein [Ralstonia pseudosolanacearum]